MMCDLFCLDESICFKHPYQKICCYIVFFSKTVRYFG